MARCRQTELRVHDEKWRRGEAFRSGVDSCACALEWRNTLGYTCLQRSAGCDARHPSDTSSCGASHQVELFNTTPPTHVGHDFINLKEYTAACLCATAHKSIRLRLHHAKCNVWCVARGVERCQLKKYHRGILWALRKRDLAVKKNVAVSIEVME